MVKKDQLALDTCIWCTGCGVHVGDRGYVQERIAFCKKCAKKKCLDCEVIMTSKSDDIYLQESNIKGLCKDCCDRKHPRKLRVSEENSHSQKLGGDRGHPDRLGRQFR